MLSKLKSTVSHMTAKYLPNQTKIWNGKPIACKVRNFTFTNYYTEFNYEELMKNTQVSYIAYGDETRERLIVSLWQDRYNRTKNNNIFKLIYNKC
jgi:hypothetical protein